METFQQVARPGHISAGFRQVAVWSFVWALLVPPTATAAEPTEDLSAAFAQAAQFILDEAGISNRSYCVVYGARKGELAGELARRSQLFVVGIEPDADNLQIARESLDAADLYGERVTLHGGMLDPAPYADYAGALVVSDAMIAYGTPTGSAAEMYRLVRPNGGVAIVGQPPGVSNQLSRVALEAWLDAGAVTDRTIIDDLTHGLWAIVRRGPLPGAGEYTQIWGDPANTGCSGDTRTTDGVRILWFGAPGPKLLIDRHNRPHPPLYKAGHLVVPGDGRVICVDAYNGARLWDVEIPDCARVAVMRNAGWLTVDDGFVFAAAGNACRKIDLRTGDVPATWTTPDPARDWGYVSVVGDRVFGSEQIAGASFIGPVGYAANSEVLVAYKGYQPIICSRRLFCRDRDTGSLEWTYDDGSVIANPTICIGDGALYFVESTAAAAVGDADGRIRMSAFAGGGSDEYLVKLDPSDGSVIWRVPKDVPFQHTFHLAYANGILLASGSSGSNIEYNFRAYNAADGSDRWSKDWYRGGSAGLDHGEQDKHAKIVGDKVVYKHGSYYLDDGADAGFSFGTSSCADYSASGNHIFYRSGGVGAVNISSGHSFNLMSMMRPGCYISTIAAGGVVMLPAYSSGCTCNFPVQTSIAWQPL